jgi:hypothetical protein
MFPPYTKINHSSPPKESYKNKYFQDSNKKLCPKKRAPNDLNSSFKEKEKVGGEGRSQFVGRWKVPMFGGPLEGSIACWPFGRFQFLVGNGRKRINTFSPLSPNKFY